MEFQTFVLELKDLRLGEEVELIVKDLTPGPRKYDSSRVKAVVSKESAPGLDTLWIRYRAGFRHPTPYYMKIINKLELVK